MKTVSVPMLLRVQDAANLLSISRSKAYEMIKCGTLPSIQLGGSVRVPRELLEQMVYAKIGTCEPEVTK